MTNPRRCKIIKCSQLAQAAAATVEALAVADASLLTDQEADRLIGVLETAVTKISEATPNPPIV